MNATAFAQLDLNPDLLDNLNTLTFTQMTPIQAESLPHILSGKDVIGQAKTGSGKTAAFALGILNQLDVASLHVQGLVICPTRELAHQVAKDMRSLARRIPNIKILTLAGGMPMKEQTTSLAYGAHIIVGTPGRIEDHLHRERLNLHHLKTWVLDEADRMLEMGFQESLEAIQEVLPTPHQSLLFSATFPSQIKKISQRIMQKPVMVQVASIHDEETIQNNFYRVESVEERLDALHLLLLQHQPTSTLIFCNTKKDCQTVMNHLIYQGFSALSLHGDLEQWERDQVMVRFRNHSTSILVATDVAARGLDIAALDMVINYHIAQDPEVHVHRMGRTGRAGAQGIACSLFSDKEQFKMTRLEDYLEHPIEPLPLPQRADLNPNINKPIMATLQLGAGKKQKIRPGDILGALTAQGGIQGDDVGDIHILNQWSYVAVKRQQLQQALHVLKNGTLKGRKVRVRII